MNIHDTNESLKDLQRRSLEIRRISLKETDEALLKVQEEFALAYASTFQHRESELQRLTEQHTSLWSKKFDDETYIVWAEAL